MFELKNALSFKGCEHYCVLGGVCQTSTAGRRMYAHPRIIKNVVAASGDLEYRRVGAKHRSHLGARTDDICSFRKREMAHFILFII